MFMLRLAYVAPAIADFALTALTLHRMTGIQDASLVPRGEFAGAALCWGILLLFGLRNPVERAWILLPTLLVIICIGLVILAGFAAGVVPTDRVIAALVICIALIWLCWIGLKRARRLSE